MATGSATCLNFTDAKKAMQWLKDVAQFKEQACMTDESTGKVMHAELSLGPVVVMPGDRKYRDDMLNPKEAGGSTGSLYIVMKDEEALRAHFEHAKAEDPASIEKEPFKTDYGSLDYSLKFDGQSFFFGTYAPAIK